MTIRSAAASLGVGGETARRWMLAAPTREVGRRRPRMVPVAVVAAPAPARTVSVISPAGFRVDGLAIDEAAALLRAVG